MDCELHTEISANTGCFLGVPNERRVSFTKRLTLGEANLASMENSLLAVRQLPGNHTND
jgi:hypothetical protein